VSAQAKPLQSGQPAAPRRAPYWIRLLLHNRVGLLGIVLVVALVILAVVAPWLAPYDPNVPEMAQRLKPALTPGHLLGTDQLGRGIPGNQPDGGLASRHVGSQAEAVGCP